MIARLVIIVLFALNPFISSCQKNSCSDVKVTYVSFLLETLISVPCQDFPNLTAEEQKTWQPKEKSTLDSLSRLLNQFAPAKKTSIDTRGTIEWRSSNGQNWHYCFDQFGHFTDGRDYFANDKLFEFVKKQIRQPFTNVTTDKKH